jgi:hypothetical protein
MRPGQEASGRFSQPGTPQPQFGPQVGEPQGFQPTPQPQAPEPALFERAGGA